MTSVLFYCLEDFPRGDFDIEAIKTALDQRLCKANPNDCETLTYFLLCVLTVSSPHYTNTVLDIENNLFAKRLYEKDMKNIKEELGKLKSYFEHMQTVTRGKYRKKNYILLHTVKILHERADHAFSSDHTKECRKYKVLLPFTFALKLLSKRKIELRAGKAVVGCNIWRELLKDIFEMIFFINVSTLRSTEYLQVVFTTEDDRIRQLLHFCKKKLGGENEQVREWRTVDIDNESKYFPPCMANLHQILRKTHRLSYDSRYQYSLFLKDAGLPLMENIQLWEAEYSQQHCGSSCRHHWEDKKGRYIYQLHHMYGLAGDFKPKRSRDCLTFIKDLTNRMDGGCPFMHLDHEELQAALPLALRNVADPILKWKNNNEPQRACAVFLSQQKIVPGNVQILLPIQYYRLARRPLRYGGVLGLYWEIDLIRFPTSQS